MNMTLTRRRARLPCLAVLLAGCGADSRRAKPGDLLSEAGGPTAQAAAAPSREAAAGGRAVSRPIDLATALRLATASHFDILEARARVREAEGRAAWADGALLPTLSGGAAVGHTHGAVQGSFGDIKDVDFGSVAPLGTLRVSWNIGQAIYGDLAAHRALDAAADFEAAAAQRTLHAVAVQYLDLVEADAAVRAHERSAAETRTILRLAEARDAQGIGSALDTERARAQAAAAERVLLGAMNERQKRSKALAAALRLDAGVDLRPVDQDLAPAALVDVSEPVEAWRARAGERRPERAALEYARVAAADEAKAAWWGAWGPELSAAGFLGGAGTTFGNVDDREGWSVFLGWTLSAGSIGRTQSAEARAEQAAIARDRFSERLQASVAAAHADVALSKEQLAPAEREARSAEQALALARARFEGGMLPESELLLAQLAADGARLKRLSAVVRYNEAQVRLLAEAGMATVEALTGGQAGKAPETR